MKSVLGGPWSYVHSQFADWSFCLCCLDAGIAFVLSYPLGWFLQMPWNHQLIMFAGVLFTSTAAIFVYLNASHKRIVRASQTLRTLAAAIDLSGAITVRLTQTGNIQHDPVSEAGVRLRAMFNDSIFTRYSNSISEGPRSLAAKLFLEQLAESVSSVDFRT